MKTDNDKGRCVICMTADPELIRSCQLRAMIRDCAGARAETGKGRPSLYGTPMSNARRQRRYRLGKTGR